MASRSSESAPPSELSIGAVYWHTDLDAGTIDESHVERQVAGTIIAEERKDESDDSPRGPTESAAVSDSNRRGGRYRRNHFRCIPLVSVVEVRMGELDVHTRPVPVHKKSDASDEHSRSRSRNETTTLRGPQGSISDASALSTHTLAPSSSFPKPASSSDIPSLAPSAAASPTIAATSLSESFKKWTLNPLMNAEDVRSARRARRSRRRRQRQANRERVAAGLPLRKEDEVESDSEDDDDDDEDLPAYKYTPPPPQHCFTVATLDRTLDLVARNTHTRDLWVYGLRMLSARADAYFNHVTPLSAADTRFDITMTVSAAVAHQTAQNDRQAAKDQDASFFHRLIHGKSTAALAAVNAQAPTKEAHSESGAHQGVCASPSAAATVALPVVVSDPVDPLSPPSRPTVLGVELHLSCRHLYPRPGVNPASFAPVALIYGELRDGSVPVPGSSKFTQWGVLLGRTERITSASLAAIAIGSRSFESAHPNFASRVRVRQLDRWANFTVRIHDTGEWTTDTSTLPIAFDGGPMSSPGHSAMQTRQGSRRNSFGASATPVFTRANSYGVTPRIPRRPSLARNGSIPSVSDFFSSEPSVREVQSSPLIGTAKFTADDLFYSLDREIVTQLVTKRKPPSIEALTRHWSPRKPTHMDRAHTHGTPEEPSTPTDPLPFVTPQDIASQDIWVRDAEGRAVVTDAMLDAYKESVFDDPHAEMPRRSLLGRRASLHTNKRNQLQVAPLLLMRVQPRQNEAARVVAEGEEFDVSIASSEERRRRESMQRRIDALYEARLSDEHASRRRRLPRSLSTGCIPTALGVTSPLPRRRSWCAFEHSARVEKVLLPRPDSCADAMTMPPAAATQPGRSLIDDLEIDVSSAESTSDDDGPVDDWQMAVRCDEIDDVAPATGDRPSEPCELLASPSVLHTAS